MEIGPEHAAGSAAFEAALAVVTEACEDTSQRLRAGIEPRPAGMVLETGEGLPLPGLQLALDEHVADQAALAGHRLERKKADSGHVLPVEAAIAATEQLVPAADREDGGPARDALAQRLCLADEIV